MQLSPQENLLLKQDLVFVDLETTGFSAQKDRVVEIGVVRIKDGDVVESYNTLVNPQLDRIPESVERITGIRPDDLVDAPTFDDVASTVYGLLRNAMFVAHNVEFDYGFIEAEFERSGLPYSAPRLCTVKLSRELYPDFISHNLDAISQRFGIGIDNRHRAMDDAMATFEFFKLSHQRLGAQLVNQAILNIIKEAKPKRVEKVGGGQMSLI